MTEVAKPVLIAGGGIGGLAAALALAGHGVASEVLEREAGFVDAGAGIQLGPNAVRILQSIGGARALEPLAVAPGHIAIHDGLSGVTLSELPLGSGMASRLGAPYWTVHRADLRAALLAAASAYPRITITNSFDVAAIRDDGAGVTVTSSAGETREGAILIGADGIWSRVRHLVFGERPLPFSGYVAYRAVLASEEVPHALRDNAVHIWLARRAHVVHYPIRGGRDHAIVLVLEEPGLLHGWDTKADPDHVRQKTEALARNISAMLAAVRSWHKWALYDPAPFPSWCKGRVALLGDAAHPVLPFLAQGGALALEDAAALAAHIARETGAPSRAFAAYERQRQARSARVQSAARRNGRIYHLSGLPARARDRVLKSRGPERLIKSYDWLYGWRDWD